MAASPATYTREEQCFVIRFLHNEGMKPIETHHRMKVLYGDACMSQQQVYKWSNKFTNSVTSVADGPRSSRAH